MTVCWIEDFTCYHLTCYFSSAAYTQGRKKMEKAEEKLLEASTSLISKGENNLEVTVGEFQSIFLSF